MQYELLFLYFHVFWSIHSDARCHKIQYSCFIFAHDSPYHQARGVFHGYSGIYLRSNLFPNGLRTFLWWTANCWKVGPSLNKTLHRSSAAHWRWSQANSSLFLSMMGVNFGSLSKSYKSFTQILYFVDENLILTNTKMGLILIPAPVLWFSHSILQELEGERAMISFMVL